MTTPSELDADTPAASNDEEEMSLAMAPGRFHAIVVERMPVGLQVWRLKPARDPATARLIATNPAAAKLTGVPIEASLGRSMADCFPSFCSQGLPGKIVEILDRRRGKILGPFRGERPDAPNAVVLVRGFRLPNRCVGLLIEPASTRSPAIPPT